MKEGFCKYKEKHTLNTRENEAESKMLTFIIFM